ncbi:MAG: NUDIX hydrolase, partial [archaeon]|nr:NUDIX hydrolase [archaeon]
DKILLVKHRKTGRFMSCGGHAEENELLHETLMREINEELNLKVEFMQNNYFCNLTGELPLPFVVSYKIDKKLNERMQIFEFLCMTDDISKLKVNQKEIIETKLFYKDEIKDSKLLTPSLKEIVLKAFEYTENLNKFKMNP